MFEWIESHSFHYAYKWEIYTKNSRPKTSKNLYAEENEPRKEKRNKGQSIQSQKCSPIKPNQSIVDFLMNTWSASNASPQAGE